MDWLALSYSLSSKASGQRVSLWRRLRRLGVVSVAGGPQVMPDRPDCHEAFGWLAQEIHQAGGDAVVMHIQHFAGLTDAQLIELFQAERAAEYGDLDHDVAALEHKLKASDHTQAKELLTRLQKRYADIAQVDYFGCPAGLQVGARLARIKQVLSPVAPSSAVPQALVADYQDKHWLTCPRPHVDRLACAWLIRRFIDPAAVIRYGTLPAPGEVAFDMEHGRFGHRGNLCSFETMRLVFGLDDPGLRSLAELVHEIDLCDGLYALPETAGVDAILTGWLASSLTDTELESRGIALFEGLYVNLFKQPNLSSQTTSKTRKKRDKARAASEKQMPALV
jgi:hypothetical protein